MASTRAPLINGDDGLPAEEVGTWAKEKHTYLRRYLDISSSTRKKYLGSGKAGATFVDLFSGPGPSRIRDTGEWIDGSAVAAWKISVEAKSDFSQVYVADIDQQRREACVERLKRLHAPVKELKGSAVNAAQAFLRSTNRSGLHFAFLDPYSLGALDFQIIRTLSVLKRIDMLIHLSAMDLQRNLDRNVGSEESAFDSFAPGWREKIDLSHAQQEIRRLVVEYWKELVVALGVWPATEMKLITGKNKQRLYWLMLAAKHELAHRFWETAANVERQGRLFA